MSGSISFIASTGGGSSSSSDSEYQILCDDNGPFIRRFVVSSTGVLSSINYLLDGVTAYTPVGTVKQCADANIELSTECFIADVAGTGYVVGDRLFRLTRFDISSAPVVIEKTWYNTTTSTVLGSIPVLTDLRPCGLAITASEHCYRAVNAGTGYGVGNTLRYTRFYDASSRSNLAFAGEIWWNESTLSPIVVDPSADVVTCRSIADGYVVVQLCDDNTPFIRHVARSPDGTITVNDTELDGTTAYTVAGAVTNCALPSFTESLICSAGVTMIRRVDKDGVVTFVTTDGAAATPTTYTIGACQQTELLIMLCDDNGSFLRRFVDRDGTLTVIDTELDGLTAYTVTGTVKNCNVKTYTESLVCDSGTTLIRRTDSDGVVTFVTTDGAAAATPASYIIGQCLPVATPITSKIERLLGTGTITVAAGARSITVQVLTGVPTVTIGTDPAVTLVRNQTLTWSADTDYEELADDFVFTGVTANDDFFVTSTRV